MFLDSKTRQALKHILDYLEDSERKDYNSRPEAERANHVYRSVEIVRDWIMREWSADGDKITITRTIVDGRTLGGTLVKGIRTVTGAASAAFFFFSCIKLRPRRAVRGIKYFYPKERPGSAPTLRAKTQVECECRIIRPRRMAQVLYLNVNNHRSASTATGPLPDVKAMAEVLSVFAARNVGRPSTPGAAACASVAQRVMLLRRRPLPP